jgi:Tol biopolymer transport system component
MRLRSVVIGAVLLSLLGVDASAQYFGQNKVQYRRHQFRVLATEHFDIYFHQERLDRIEVVGRLAERWQRRLSAFFGRDLDGRQPIVLYASKPDFDQTLVIPGLIDAGTAGVTEPWRRRIALPVAGSLADTDHVLGHEIVHAFQMDLMAAVGPGAGATAAAPLDLWAIEGLAEYLSLGPVETHTAMWLRDAVRHGALPRLDDLSQPEFFPYRWGHAFWAYVGGRWGDATAARLFSMASFTGMTAAIETVLATTVDVFTLEWQDALRAAYPPAGGAAAGTHVAGASPPGIHVAGAPPPGGSINVGAAISPDGRWIAFLTERLFAVDLVVADALTGRVAATLTDTAADPHYSSLQYIGSAAAWDAHGERLAISTLTSGRPALSIFRWPGGALERDVVIDGVDEVFGPAWSPDGKAIAFSAMSEGATDLFVFDLERSVLRRFTDDLYADLQPAWSPDGGRLAFVTDRFTTDLTTLTAGAYRLAVADVAGGAVQAVDAFPSGKHIAPQWSRDGRRLFFISDRDGTPDVYAVNLQDGALARFTEASSGVAGLTVSSPALSIAAAAGTAAVTVYEGGVFAVHTLALTTGGAPGSDSPGARRLPPDGTGTPDRVFAADDPAAPPASDAWPVSPYRRHLALEQVSQAGIGAGIGAFGMSTGGDVALTFSDVLHTHWLVAAARLATPIGAGASLRDLAAYSGYANHARRWWWGVFGQVNPTYVGVRVDAEPLDIADTLAPFVVVRQLERTARGAFAYPFSRARRIELHGGIARLEFDEVRGSLGKASWSPAAVPLTLVTGGVAFVSDTSHAGPTSVVHGERYRFEVTPVAGAIRYVDVTADYRRYLMPVPFYTIAARALHVGRYGGGGDDPRLAPLYLGYPWLVRGFDRGWRDVNDCVTILVARCPELDDLLGSRVVVGNLELRVPLLRPLGLSRSMYGPVPAEVAVFLDGGLTWRSSRPALDPPTGGVWSAGVTLRTSLDSFGIGQFDLVRPFGAARDGWTLQFSLTQPF